MRVRQSRQEPVASTITVTSQSKLVTFSHLDLPIFVKQKFSSLTLDKSENNVRWFRQSSSHCSFWTSFVNSFNLWRGKPQAKCRDFDQERCPTTTPLPRKYEIACCGYPTEVNCRAQRRTQPSKTANNHERKQ